MKLDHWHVHKCHFFDLGRDFMAIATPDGQFVELNDRWTEVLGWSIEELVSRPFLEFIHPEDHQRVADNREVFETTNFIIRFRCKDGSWRWLNWSSVKTSLEDGLIYAVARDETELYASQRRLVEREAELAFLLGEIQRVREEELGRFAGLFHDRTLQNLLAADMTLDFALGAGTDDAPETLRAHCATAHELLRASISGTRDVLQDLAPIHMDDLPLASALRSHARQVADETGAAIHVDLIVAPVLDAVTRLLAFRVVRGAVRHAIDVAHATDIHVHGRLQADTLALLVHDDAATPVEPANADLSLLEQQVRTLGGTLRRRSARGGGGGEVSLVLPIIPLLDPPHGD